MDASPTAAAIRLSTHRSGLAFVRPSPAAQSPAEAEPSSGVRGAKLHRAPLAESAAVHPILREAACCGLHATGRSRRNSPPLGRSPISN